MSRELLVGAWIAVAVLLVGAGRASAQTELPVAELDPHFRWSKEGHAYTRAMLELGMRMGAATAASLRDDRTRAMAALKAFREQHAKVAAMVPSWKPLFRSPGLDELESAVAANAELAVRRRAIGRLEKSCTACHARYMFPVQARYRWGSFASASVPGEKGASLSFHQVMLDLASGIGAVRGDVEAGQLPEAQAAYRQLTDRFNMMEQLCANCHDQPRQYFIDSAVKARLYKVGGLLRRGERNAAEYQPLFNDINEMSCMPCHQVHMPAAFEQEAQREGRR